MHRARDLFRWPSIGEWGLTGLAMAGFAVLAAGFGLATGLYTYALATDMAAFVRTAVIAFFAPALFEELAFRGPLVWLALRRGRAPVWVIIASLALFVLWHPVNAAIYLTEARDLFFDWRFLTVTAGLGAVASWLVLRTRSIWPAVLFHWCLVLGWKAFLGAPEFF